MRKFWNFFSYIEHEIEAIVKLIKGYDWEIYYHQGKANMVTDTLSRKKYIEEDKSQNNWWEGSHEKNPLLLNKKT